MDVVYLQPATASANETLTVRFFYSTATGNRLRRSPSLKAEVKHMVHFRVVSLESPAAGPDLLTMQIRDDIFRS